MAAIREATPTALAHYKQARAYLKQQGLDECLKVYVSWDSRKQAIKLKLWNVPQANRGKLSELGFKFVSPLYGPRELSAIVYIDAAGVVMPAAAPARRVVRKPAGVGCTRTIEFVNPAGIVVGRYYGKGSTVDEAFTDAAAKIAPDTIAAFLSRGHTLQAG